MKIAKEPPFVYDIGTHETSSVAITLDELQFFQVFLYAAAGSTAGYKFYQTT